MLRTYKYKLYNTKKLNHIHRTINIAGIIYNHCMGFLESPCFFNIRMFHSDRRAMGSMSINLNTIRYY